MESLRVRFWGLYYLTFIRYFKAESCQTIRLVSSASGLRAAEVCWALSFTLSAHLLALISNNLYTIKPEKPPWIYLHIQIESEFHFKGFKVVILLLCRKKHIRHTLLYQAEYFYVLVHVWRGSLKEEWAGFSCIDSSDKIFAQISISVSFYCSLLLFKE